METQLQQQLETSKVVNGGDVENLAESKFGGVTVTEARQVESAEVNNGGCETVLLKRKRGRPAKGKTILNPTPPPIRPKKDEEDVCFICFDGGSLVLCDRRGCPKAYHPSCIKRDESFFRSKAKWNCGWHICSDCGKTSHYMCYTCTYSLCKGCTKDADFVCVRGNKGLCGMCKKTIMLIENSAQGNKAKCEVDFDDKGSWEYLFKVYWLYLKEKLSLTFDEIVQAKNPYKDIESNNLKNKAKRSDKRRHNWNGSLNDVGWSTRDLLTSCEKTVNICIIKNLINPNEIAINDSTNAGIVRLEASGVAGDISSSLLSTGMELPFSDFVNDKPWHYQDPTGKVQGPFSILQLYKWKASGYFPPDLRIWKIDEKQDKSILLTDVLSGKCSNNASLPNKSQQLSLGANGTFNNKEISHDGGSNVTTKEHCVNSQIVGQSGEPKVDDTCTQSNGKDESVRSNGWHSQSPCWTIQADGNNNEGQSGNFERREESSKCEISCHDHPNVNPSLPSTAFPEKLIENPSDKLREAPGNEGNTEENGNFDLNRIFEGQSNSGQSCQKQSDSEENSGQSTDQNWRCPNETHPVCNTSTWLAIFGEPTDFDESVSDLLAEVEAMEMESFGGLESPTSIMKCGEELTDGSITDCLRFADGLSPMLDAGKGDALSSTGDLQLPSQSTTAEKPFQQADAHHHQRISGEQSSKSSEVESTFSGITWNPTIQFSWGPNC